MFILMLLILISLVLTISIVVNIIAMKHSTPIIAEIRTWYLKILTGFINWLIANPLRAFRRAFNAALFFSPNAISNAFLTAFGWGATGPNGGVCMSLFSMVPNSANIKGFLVSLARFLMSDFGYVPARGLYAILQSARMGGYGTVIVAYWVRVWAVACEVIAHVFGCS